MSNEAFARVKIDSQLRAVDWNLEDGSSVHFEYILPDKTKADYVLLHFLLMLTISIFNNLCRI